MIKIEKEGEYMGKKIFVSYKYADDFVENLEEEVAFLHTIVRQHSREIEKLKHA